jgi:tetratricopeptide (TPR) repeat protein
MKLITTLKALTIIGAALVPAHQPLQAQSVAELMAKGDASDRTLEAGDALKNYQLAEKLEPANVRILVSIARQYRHLMTDAGTVREKLRLGDSALAYGKKAALIGPKDSEAQLSTAITYGKMLPYLDKKDQVDASPRIKAAAERAIKLDPRNDTAWHVLGRWHQSLANVSGVRRAVGEVLYGKLPHGTNEESIACFEKAIAINPNRLRHYIEKGRSHAQMEQNTIARQLIQKGMAMPNKEKDDQEVKLRGRETLAKLP